MKILILGSTGPTGQELVKQSLNQNHDVTVLARDPSKLKLKHTRLSVIKGNVLDRDLVMKIVEEKDAVLSALGTGKSLKSGNLISNTVDILIPVMNEKNVKRLIFLSAFGVGKTFEQASFIQKIAFRLPLKSIYADKSTGDEKIMNSNLDWTIVYPVLLTNKPHSGNYKAGENFPMKGMPKISRADVADFMLRQLTDATYLKKCPIIMM
jgi:putative NADH-flavin reductase